MDKHFVEKRLIEHSKCLFDTLTKGNKKEPASSRDVPVDIEIECIKKEALKYIDIARTRDFDVEELLTYELRNNHNILLKKRLQTERVN